MKEVGIAFRVSLVLFMLFPVTRSVNYTGGNSHLKRNLGAALICDGSPRPPVPPVQGLDPSPRPSVSPVAMLDGSPRPPAPPVSMVA